MNEYVESIRAATAALQKAEETVAAIRRMRRMLLKGALDAGATATSLQDATGMSRQAIMKDIGQNL